MVKRAKSITEPTDIIDLIKIVDVINTINLIDVVNTITTISGITNVANVESVDLIDLITKISEITIIKTVEAITNIASLDLIDRITLVDLVTEITTIGTINKINPDAINNVVINLIDKITEISKINPDATHNVIIDLITEITTVKTIDKVTLIDLITKVSEITNVGTIERINFGIFDLKENIIKDSGFESRDWLIWKRSDEDNAILDNTVFHSGKYSLKLMLKTGIATITQYLNNVLVDEITPLFLWVATNPISFGHGVKLTVQVFYTDATSSSEVITPTIVWTFYTVNLTSGKRVQYIRLYLSTAEAGDVVWVDDLYCTRQSWVVTQLDETKLKATVTQAADVKVVQPTAADLKAMVTQAEKDRIITSITKGDYLSALPNPPNLDVALSTRLKKEDLNLDANKDLQVDVKTAPSIYVHQVSIDRIITSMPQRGSIIHISKTATGDIITPESGKKVAILGYFYYSSADITTELRFKTSGSIIAGLTVKGAVGMNLIGMKPPTGAIDEIVEIYLSDAGTVKGWVCYEEVEA